MDGHAPANQLRLSLPGADRVKPERNLEAAKPPSAKCDPNLRPPSWAQVTEPPYTDPYVRWCGRGGAVRLPPIPIRARYCGPAVHSPSPRRGKTSHGGVVAPTP